MSKITKKQVIENICSQLKGIKFSGRIPDIQTMNESVLKEIVTYFDKKIITDTIIREIIGYYVLQEVSHKNVGKDLRSKEVVKFASFPDVDVDSVVNNIFEHISKLPEEYNFILKFPKTRVNFKKVTFTRGIDLLVLNNDKIKKLVGEDYRERGLRRLAVYPSGREPMRSGDVALVIKGKGYVGKYGIINLNIVDPLYTFKVILGIYNALGIIQHSEYNNYLKPVFEYYCISRHSYNQA